MLMTPNELLNDEAAERKTFKHVMFMLYHNIIAHPISGICWFFGANKLGDRIHGH